MKFGVSVSTADAARDGSWLARLERIAAWGFDGVELRVDDPRDLDAVRAVREAIARLRLEATVAGSADPAVAVEQHVCELVDVCAVLDAHVLCGPFPFGADRAGVAKLAHAAAYAREFGVTLALGGVDSTPQHRPRTVAETSRLIDAAGAPNAGVLYNTYRAHVDESSISSAVLAAGDRLRHVQIVENDGTAPGRGQVRWSETFAALDAIRYDGWYVVDVRSGDDVETIAPAGLRFLQRYRPRAASV